MVSKPQASVSMLSYEARMMTDYLRYYLSPLTLMIAVFGLVMGGPYVWLGLATLPALALGDAVLPRDLAERRITNHSLAVIPVVISSALAFVPRQSGGCDYLKRLDRNRCRHPCLS
jgi:hypothetical protein